MNSKNSAPLVVDLDGTLIKTDLLLETFSRFMTTRPWQVLRLLSWLLFGRANLKARLAKISAVDASALPYNRSVLSWLAKQKSNGATLVLATASDSVLAHAIAKHLDIFDEVLASDGTTNLRAHAKRDALIERYGERGFDYVGNSTGDLPIWAAARQAHIVSSDPGLIAKVKAFGNAGQIWDAKRAFFAKHALYAMRPHQWVKNLLIFVPLLVAHQYLNFHSVAQAVLAFVIFGLTASSIYLFNDLADVDHDRHHPRKKNRPFASGDLSLLYGWLLFPLLLATAIGVAFLLPPAFTGYMLGYVALSVSYSMLLKRIAMLDILVLAGLYTLRIIAGAAAIAVPLSFWLLTFAMFIFASLAFIKRFCELKQLKDSGDTTALRGRGYEPDDTHLIALLGVAAGYVAVLVLALYIQDNSTVELYRTPKIIWLACPVVLYWVSRIWLIAHRGRMYDDPIVFALKDWISWVAGICLVIIFGLARYAA